MDATLRSQVAAFGRPRGSNQVRVVEKAFRYASDERGVERLERRVGRNALAVTYEDLLREPDAVMADLQARIGLPVRKLVSDYDRFESFRDGAARGSELTQSGRIAAAMCMKVVARTPFAILKAIRERHDRRTVVAGPLYTRVPGGGDEGRRRKT